MQGLVYIGKILSLSPIPEADRIEAAIVVCGKGGKWEGVVQTGQFQTGNLVRVYLQDCILPQTEEFAFMEKYKWRIKIQKMRGVNSECLIMPYHGEGEVGDNITAQSEVQQYIKVLPLDMTGTAVDSFPSFIPKTDEPNFQTVPEQVEALQGQPFGVTIKYDGTSCTMYYHKGHFGVCSRTREIEEGDNVYWKIAREYDVENILQKTGMSLALQMELVGPKIQGNPLELLAVQPRLFDVFSIIHGKYSPGWILSLFSNYIPIVKTVEDGEIFMKTDEELRACAEAQVYEGTNTPAEGIVIRPRQEQRIGRERLSFKVINPLYKEV